MQVVRCYTVKSSGILGFYGGIRRLGSMAKSGSIEKSIKIEKTNSATKSSNMVKSSSMAKTSSARNPEVLADSAKNIFSGIVAFFVIIVLSVFPLYYDNYYFNILKAKYQFYFVTILCMFLVCLIIALVFCFIDRMEYDGYNTKSFFESISPRKLWKNLTVVDKSLLIFLLLAIISTLQSDYLFESFWGNEGRFSGLFLITLYVVSVLIIGKLGRIKKWHLELFLLAGLLVCLFGITDYFRMDILHWKAGVKSGQQDSFTSTMGNINTYTAYVALVLGVSGGLFASEKNIFRTIGYFIATVIGFCAIIMGQSDNAYLALGALFGLLPLILFGTRTGIKRYAVLVAAFATVMKCVAVINLKVPDKVIGLSGIFGMLTKYDKLTYIVIALWAAVIVLYIGDRLVYKEKADKVGKWLRLTWLALIAVALGVIIWILYDANFGGHAERYQAFSQYLIFNDNWGTNRGYCWRIGWESYMQQPLMHRLFGYGPDTFGILTWGFREESLATYGVFFESAHNEYFQYLVTMGPFTLLAYLAFLLSSCAMMVKNLARQPWILAPLAAVVCYGAQAFVNINLPIATPIMWAMLAVGLAMCRNSVQKEKADGIQSGLK